MERVARIELLLFRTLSAGITLTYEADAALRRRSTFGANVGPTLTHSSVDVCASTGEWTADIG